MTLIELARKFHYLREASGQNDGQRVEAVQKWGGGKKGDSWCAFWATMVLDIFYEGKSPIPRAGGCDVILELARTNGWLNETPHVGDLYLYLKSPTDAHHVGIVTDVNADGYSGISGNTSEDGLSSNGDRVAERALKLKPSHTIFVRYPR